MRETRSHCWILGLVFAEIFVMVVLKDFLTPLSEPVRRGIEITLPGFNWATPATILLGIVESFLWGAYLELLIFPMIKTYAVKHYHYSLPGSKPHSHAA